VRTEKTFGRKLQRTDPVGSTIAKPVPRVILYQPEIPQNTGNIARTCAATNVPLHLIEPLGFRLDDRHLKRAGLDYWPHVNLRVHPDLDALRNQMPHSRWIYFSTHARHCYYDFDFLPGDCLVFGSETCGLPAAIMEREQEQILRVPVDHSRVRSLNLATTVGVVLFEVLRQFAVSESHFGPAKSKLAES
jgi:tRNA (cytidine/uridine-2'-O-)-methyltransferase